MFTSLNSKFQSFLNYRYGQNQFGQNEFGHKELGQSKFGQSEFGYNEFVHYEFNHHELGGNLVSVDIRKQTYYNFIAVCRVIT